MGIHAENDELTVILGSVIYHDSLKYFEGFKKSIIEQDCQEFDVLLLLDKVDRCEIDLSGLQKNRLEILEIRDEISIFELRMYLIRRSIERGADLLLFADSDDGFSLNRVSKHINSYSNEYGFYYNDLRILGGEKRYFSEELPHKAESIKCLLQSNFVGLSCASVNLKMIAMFITEIESEETSIFDWFFFSFLLLKNIKGKKVEDCFTYYRLRTGVGAAAQDINSVQYIRTVLEIRSKHYCILKKYANSYDDLCLTARRALENLEKYTCSITESRKFDHELGYPFWWNIEEETSYEKSRGK